MNQQTVFYLLAAAGVVFVADFAPKLVNGILILILVGMVLKHVGAFDTFIRLGTGVAKAGA